MKNKATVLYIDKEVNEDYLNFLKKHFTIVLSAISGKEGLSKFITHNPDLIITDINMPDMNAPELIHNIRNTDKVTPIIILSEYANEPFLTESFNDMISGHILKPVDYKKLSFLIDTILSKKKNKVNIDEKKLIEDNSENMHHSSEHDLMVVGIGASAGGLEALSSLVAGLPKDNNTAYVLAQHLSPTHKTMLVDLLSRETTLHIKDAENKEVLSSDIFYITPPNNNIEINENNEIILSAPEKHSFLPKPSVNQLFISIAEQKKDKAVGIILSGTGSDGAQGMRAINAEGGITIVQEPTSAKYDGMPMAALNGCSVDIVIESGLIGEELVALANFPRQKVLKKHQLTQPNDEITTIFDFLYRYKKVDFSVYKKTTIGRRIERRMVALKVTTLSDYVEIIKKNEKEVELLYKDILIGVTVFFRDKEAFESFRNLLDNYLDENPDISELRMWMPGSSTGEEAYSIAITIKELLLRRQQNLSIKIFATDIDDDALKIARKGIYSQTSMNQISEEYINKYFVIKNNEFEVKKSLRENIVFSFHNLLADPPFKNLNLIVCRNLLIYFNLEAQKYIMPTFHYALCNNGLLFLGKSENATNFEHFFMPIDKQNKIFKSVPTSSKDYNSITIKAPSYTKSTLQKLSEKKFNTPLQETVILEASKLLMPNIIVTNEQLEVVYKKGDLDYINIPEGYVSYNLYKIIDPQFTINLRSLVNNAKKNDEVSSSSYVPLNSNGKVRLIKVYLVPIINNRSRMFIFYFNEISDTDIPELNFNISNTINSSDKMLELELHRTKEHMQTLIEELETSNEELQSTNEELQSSNEELQSTNEEMETSNEELQSTNEELQTAYAELKEMYQNNTDIRNDLSSLNRRYESVLENINDAVIISNAQGIFIRTNTAMQRYTGLSKERLLAKNWSDFFGEENNELFKKRQFELTFNGKFGPYVLELYITGKEVTFLKISDYMSKDDEGNIQIWSFASDISKEKSVLSKLSLSEQKYKNTFERANIGIAHVSLSGKWIRVNESLCEILGYSEKKLLSLTFQKITYIEDLNVDLLLVKSLLNGEKENYKLEKRYYKKDGSIIWAMLSVSIVRDKDKNPLYFISVIEDISAQKLAEQINAQSEIVFNATQEAIVIADSTTKIININPAFIAMSGYSRDNIIGKYTNILKSGRHSDKFYDEMFKTLKKTGFWSGEVINRNKDGETYPAYLNINTVLDKYNNIIQYIGVLTDISLIKQSQDKVHYLANHDTLTELPNRTLFNDRLKHSLAQARRSKKHVALLFIDLDRFKVVNDGLGHQVGDEVLIKVSKRFKNILRNQDTVARLGGDEFVVIVEDLDSPLSAGKIAQNLIDCSSKIMNINEHSIQIGSSIGISIYPNDGLTAEELLRQADIAMYEAKNNGRNTYRFTTEELSSNALEKSMMENAVREGLDKGEFEVFYQPIFSFKTMKIEYLEALIRWNHPQLGLVLPSKFIPMAEESELITEITKHVIFEVMKSIHDLLNDNNCKSKISINFSLKDLKNDSLFHLFKKYMQKFNIKGENLIIEITERELIVDNLANQENLSRYRRLGISFSMDDFGTGYSNLGYLIDKPFNALKIDRTFISKIGIDIKSEEIIKATISIAKALKLETIGEGIETKEQFNFLKDNGCDFAQGFYLEVPEPICKLIELIKKDEKIILDKR